ncbi:hypothetical protein BDV96DRAFT_682187 [Lophiotrema nucula]|uniref:Uncharacterized protein n=1 Tax=Lophiotrema nucula TaxID=690887 RepID=A0A6A5ZRT3_9PLEO|nr:hypothetical protein BDV96DRAFT_682187 [Lophiotrema nucula]
MRPLFLLSLLFAVLCLAKEGDFYCHSSDDKDGKTCRFKDYCSWMAAAHLYCQMYTSPLQVAVEGEIFYAKIRVDSVQNPGLIWGWNDVPYGIFLGNIQFDSNYGNMNHGSGYWNILTYDRCIEYMPTIWNKCGGEGGKYVTGYGTVTGECIRA